MIEKLERNPNAGLVAQDEEAKILLFELGVVDRFKNIEELRTQVVVIRDHPSHYILGLCFSGQADPQENGFQISCFPKSKVSPAGFQKIIGEFNLGDDVIHAEGFGGPPTNN